MDVLQIEDLDDAVEQTIRQIRRGVYQLSKANIVARLPEKVDFDVLVVMPEGFQALDVNKSDVRDSDEGQGGYTVDERKDDTKTTDDVVSNETQKRTGNTVGVEDSTTTDVSDGTDRKTTNSGEVRNATEGGLTTETTTNEDISTQNGSEARDGANQHIQDDSDSQQNNWGDI